MPDPVRALNPTSVASAAHLNTKAAKPTPQLSPTPLSPKDMKHQSMEARGGEAGKYYRGLNNLNRVFGPLYYSYNIPPKIVWVILKAPIVPL